ncbi:MAG: hypothetical protein E5W53_22470, partial [Mesorhizobium sp.]
MQCISPSICASGTAAEYATPKVASCYRRLQKNCMARLYFGWKGTEKGLSSSLRGQMSACISFREVKSFRCLVILFGLLIGLNSPAMSDDMVLRGPTESWVKQVDIPAADPARSDQVKNGISWLLSDDQINHRAVGYVEYWRTVYKIVDRPGLEQGAGIDLQFDPSRHKVTLNHLQIIRDGAVLD